MRAEISALKESEERVRGHEQQLREKLSELTSRADAASEAGLNVLDTSIAASADTDEETRADRQNEETLKEQVSIFAQHAFSSCFGTYACAHCWESLLLLFLQNSSSLESLLFTYKFFGTYHEIVSFRLVTIPKYSSPRLITQS